METIKIAARTRKQLCKEICLVIERLTYLNGVECAYLNTYKWHDKYEIKTKYFLKITVVSKYPYVKSVEDYIHELNDSYNKDAEYPICLAMDNSSKYEYVDLRPTATVRRKKLQNATVLFDLTGKYNRIKNESYRSYSINSINDPDEVMVEPPLKRDIDNTYLKLSIDSFKKTQKKAIKMLQKESK